MTKSDNPTVVKKYANRRLYHTGTSAYVTLEELGEMVKQGEDFIVVDAKTGEDITHSVLTQIIFEEESKGTQSLLPINFLRQLIRFYGDSMQAFVPHYLEATIGTITAEQDKLRQQFQDSFGMKAIGAIEEQARKNMDIMRETFRMFTPFAQGDASAKAGAPDDEITQLKAQLKELNQRLSAVEGQGR